MGYTADISRSGGSRQGGGDGRSLHGTGHLRRRLRAPGDRRSGRGDHPATDRRDQPRRAPRRADAPLGDRARRPARGGDGDRAEALGALRTAGLLRTTRGRRGGSFVCSPADDGRSALLDRLRGLGKGELRDLGDHYAAIGGTCAALASQRADDSDVARLETLAPAVRDGRTASEWLRAEGAFHLELAVAAQSARLAREEIELQAEVGPLLWLAHAHADTHEAAADSHEHLARPWRTGTATAARSMLEDHVHQLVQALRPLHHEARRSR